MLINVLIVTITVIAMEAVAAWAHRYIMHGWGWRWHQSHHSPRTGWFELNDLYAVVFALVAIGLIALGNLGFWPLHWIGTGMTLYGALYFLVHDGLVHQRWPFHWVPRKGYLKRLYLAHRLHHAVRGRENCVSFGFLYAEDPALLQQKLRQRRARPHTMTHAHTSSLSEVNAKQDVTSQQGLSAKPDVATATEDVQASPSSVTSPPAPRRTST